MNITEAFRRGVISPRDSTALQLIKKDEINNILDYECVSFQDKNQYYRLWESGFFDKINSRCGSLITDHEVEEIPADQLANLLGTLVEMSKYPEIGQDRVDAEIINDIMNIVAAAIKKEMAVYFVL